MTRVLSAQPGVPLSWLWFVPRLPYRASPRRRFRRTGARSV